MTEQESIILVTNYFHSHGLDLSRTTIDDNGNIHLIITPDSFQHIPQNIKNELDNRYKLFVRVGYSGNTQNNGVHSGSYQLISDVPSIPKHWYCDENENPLPDTDGNYLLSACNPSSGVGFKQSPFLLYNSCFSNIELWKGINQDIINGSYSFGQGFSKQTIDSFDEWRNQRLELDGKDRIYDTHLYCYRFTMCVIAQIVFSSAASRTQQHIAYFASPIYQWETTEGLINQNPPQWHKI